MRRLRSSRWAAASAVALATASPLIGGGGSAPATRNHVHGARATTTPVPDRPLETAGRWTRTTSKVRRPTLRTSTSAGPAQLSCGIMMNWIESGARRAESDPPLFPREVIPVMRGMRGGLIDDQVRDSRLQGIGPVHLRASGARVGRSGSCGRFRHQARAAPVRAPSPTSSARRRDATAAVSVICRECATGRSGTNQSSSPF